MTLEIKEGGEEQNTPAPAAPEAGAEATKINPEELAKDSPEYQAYFVAKGRGEDPDAAVAALTGEKPADDELTPMPEGGREKFYNKETGEYDWKSHAIEAEYNKTRKKDDKSEDAEGGGDEGGEGDDNDGGEVADLVAKAGLKVEDLQSQIMQNGEIDEVAKDALVKSGLPRSLIDEYETLAVAYMDTVEQKAYDHVGGEDKFQQMSAWAAQNLSDEDKAHINGLLSGPNWQSGVDTLQARYNTQVPNPKEGEVNLLSGDGAGNGQVGYKDKAQMMSDMRDPRYQTSEAYRQEVAMKIKHASW